MIKRTHHLGALAHLGAVALAAAFLALGLAASARPLAASGDDSVGISRGELGRLDLFLDSHPDIAKAFEANPALATNNDFVSDHPAWKAFLTDHPEIRDGLIAHPAAFMSAEDRFDAAETKPGPMPKGPVRGELREFAGFLNQHPAIAKELEGNPSLIENKNYVADHPELEAFVKDKPALRDNLLDNPQAVLRGVAAVESAETSASTAKPASSGSSTTTTASTSGTKPTMPPTKAPPENANDSLNRGEIITLGNFLDGNPALAKQLEANPSLIDNPTFLKDNAELVTFLQSHPDLAQDWRGNAALTMTDLRRVDQLEAARTIGNERATDIRSAVVSLDNFLDSHPVIASEIDHHSSLASNVSFIDAHPQLKLYLQKNPGVAAQLKNNPQSFMNLLAKFDKNETPRAEKKEDLKPKLAKLNR